MAIYSYEALDSGGNKVAGIIDADSEEAARGKLRDAGLFPSEMRLGADSAGGPWSGRIGVKEVSAFTRQLATLVGAGFTIVDALSTMADQVSNVRFKRVLMGMRDRVREGKPLSDAVRDFPDVFPGMFAPMVKAGEKSGKLAQILAQLSGYLENRVRFQAKILTAVAYPVVMACVAVGVVIFLLAYVIPPLIATFRAENIELPLVTKILIALTDGLKDYGVVALAALVAGVVGLRKWLATENGRELTDEWMLKIWVVGNLYRQILISRFVRTFGVLMKSDVQILMALDILRSVVQNVVVERALDQAKLAISQGAPIARPLKASGIFPPLVIDMISAGQKSGQLDTLLLRLADDYELEVETSLSLFTSVLEPIIILAMGLVVGFIVLAVVLPMMELNQRQV